MLETRADAEGVPKLHVYREVAGLRSLFEERRETIRSRLVEFLEVGREPDERIFAELCFCLLTPQTKARSCDKAILGLTAANLLLTGTPEQIAKQLRGIRFHNTKARWIVAARERFLRDGRWRLREQLDSFQGPVEAREWLAENVLGMGYKEAAHFLRNIGRGENLAILDRHIMRNLHRHGVLSEIPDSLSRKRYLRIEGLMSEFSDRVGISLAELDLLFWSRETGEVFK